MNTMVTFLGYCIAGIIVFYVAMFFFAESIPLPYGNLPDGMKIERMIAAEIIECLIAAGDQDLTGSLMLGAPKSAIVSGATDIMTRDALLERRDVVCRDVDR